MMGYGNSLSPYLGGPWVKTALHLLDGKDTGGDDHITNLEGGKLPKPKLPPNATHTQLYVLLLCVTWTQLTYIGYTLRSPTGSHQHS